VLLAMGVDKALAASAIRVSGGWNSTQNDFVKLVAALKTQ
jgi:cysteine sulfinate desulfinase/cysteine desulfurase-like protein